MTSWKAQLLTLLALASVSFSSPVSSFAPRAHVVERPADLRAGYDYIVIGGGTSGLVVANRLTEDPKITVLVIEYGYVDGQENGTATPGLPVPEKYSRNYQSIPQPQLDGRTSPIYTGAVVGGGTVVNGMFFNRGSAGDYDAWEKLGNLGWTWNDLLPYFKKSETFNPPSDEIAAEFPGIISEDLAPHGTNGPVDSSFSNFQYPVIHNFFRGWNAIGLDTQPQPSDGDANGVFYGPVSIKGRNQSRDSASTAYYRPIAQRKNFHLITGSTVSKINFHNKVACSVDFISRETNETSTASAKREVILAAGAPHSPQILQLSGVGPQALLSGLGIDVIEDLPGVGLNFQDQPSMFMQYEYGNYPFPTPDWYFSNQTWLDEQIAIYYENRTGPVTIPYLSGSSVAFLPLQNTTDDWQQIVDSAAELDAQTVLQPVLGEEIDETILAGYEAQADLTLELWRSAHATAMEVAWGGGNTLPIAMLKPLSRGVITINSTDPTAPPVFDYGTFEHPADLDVAVACLKKARDFMNSGPMQEVGASETYPGSNVTTDEQIAASIRTFATSTWAHPTSSLSMMKRELGGVVDAELRVYGIKNLRVVDASIMPLIIGSHTSSTVYAVAEKAADIIKAAQKSRW